ncbi:esterase-like activity of phytase family protein [Wenxinia marina]|uniref:Phytase-like domain-containing protein n=1 Tax=Wenxinia marina DSM 24838 TaxID=1123501 RepID=A0A0D0QIQ9_9RHOB|nr:esterase-like activity of phytase family protein [Wenxinia marina]KIQ70948.1 hypothetical protein Wenmar_00324 [Wenxinia marina DSM 24838]GGL56060.1 hypothetical protein GCM10011392_08110 [Wenxinia marina]
MRVRFPIALALWAGVAVAGVLRQDSVVWTMDDPGFGGFSAIHVFPGGERFVAVSDRAMIVEGQFLRDGNGDITAVESRHPAPLPDENGDPIEGVRADSEGVAVGPDGTIYLSFEGVARLRVEDAGDGLPRRLPRHPDFATLQSNSALEALAIGPDGALYTIPERSGRADRPFPVYRLKDGAWDIPFELPRRGPFLVSGADIGPDGRLYVLERDFTGIGFRSRVRRFDLAGGSEETLLETGTGVHDNLEGISVWRQADGRLRMTLISDDNFRWFQVTEIAEYVLDE